MTIKRSRMSVDIYALQLNFPVHPSRRYGRRSSRRRSSRSSRPLDTCFICEDAEFDVVVSKCCDLFCWPCLYTWLHYYSSPQKCPWCNCLLGDDYSVTRARGFYGEPDRKSRPFLAKDTPIPPTDQVAVCSALLEN